MRKNNKEKPPKLIIISYLLDKRLDGRDESKK